MLMVDVKSTPKWLAPPHHSVSRCTVHTVDLRSRNKMLHNQALGIGNRELYS